jgi:hypothetical protein
VAVNVKPDTSNLIKSKNGHFLNGISIHLVHTVPTLVSQLSNTVVNPRETTNNLRDLR